MPPPPRNFELKSLGNAICSVFCVFSINTAKILVIYIYVYFNCYILATKSFLRGSDDRLCKLKMIGEIRQNFTEASASVGLILATALIVILIGNTCTKW